MYVRQPVSRKAVLKPSQQYARLATGVRLLSNSMGADASAGVAGGAVTITVAAASCPGSRRLGVQPASSLTPEQQLGLIAVNGVSLTAFNGIRRGVGVSRVGLASVPVFRASRK